MPLVARALPGGSAGTFTDLRRFDRFTAADVQLRDRKLAFHIGEAPPVVTRFLIERYQSR